MVESDIYVLKIKLSASNPSTKTTKLTAIHTATKTSKLTASYTATKAATTADGPCNWKKMLDKLHKARSYNKIVQLVHDNVLPPIELNKKYQQSSDDETDPVAIHFFPNDHTPNVVPTHTIPAIEPVVQTIVPGFLPTQSMGNVGVASKLPECVPPQTMGNVGAGTKLPEFAPTFSQIPKQPTSKSVMRFGSLNTPYISRYTSETLTTLPLTSASLPVDNFSIEILQEEQKQQEIHVEEVLVLGMSSKGEQLMVESPQQRDEGTKSSYRPLDPEASICNRNEMLEFKKYLTGTEQKNMNDGAAVLTATLTGHENDCISVQKSVEDDIANAEDDSEKDTGRNSGEVEGIENSNSVQNSLVEDKIENAEDDSEKDTGRNSGDIEGIENSNSVQNSRVEDKIENAEDDLGNAATGRNSRDMERVENSNSESSNSDEEYDKATTKQENPEVEQSEIGDSESSTSDEEDGMVIDQYENSEVEESEASDYESSNTDKEDAMVITEPENVDGEQGKTGDSNSRNMMSVSVGGNTEQLEDNDTDSNSSEEEGDVGNKSGNPEDVVQVSKPEQPENSEQLNIAELENRVVSKPEPGGRFVNYFTASHRIPKAIDVVRAKRNVIPLSEICRIYLGINRDMVAVYMSCCKMKCSYKLFCSSKFQSLEVCSTSSLNVDTLDKKLQDITVLSSNTLYKPNSAAKLSDTEGKNYHPLPTYF